MNINFYKHNDLLTFGDLTVNPNMFIMEENSPTEITIRWSDRSDIYLNGVAIGSNIPVANFKRYNETGYASVAEIKAECKDFFASADFTSLIQAVQNSGGTQLKPFSNTLTRTGLTPYTAQDVIGGVLTIANVAKATGTGVRINRIRIQTNDTGVAGKRFNVHVFNELPTVAADNSALVIDWSNRLKRAGAISIVMGTGNFGTEGTNDWSTITLSPIGRDVFIVIESADGFTPSANSTEFRITTDTELSNN